MQVTETLSDGLKRAYTVVVPAADIETRRTERLVSLGKTLRLPGFRPGKVPMPIIRQRFGTAVSAEVLEESVSEATRQVLTDRGLRPAMQPKVDVTGAGTATAAPPGDLEFKVELELLPDITLPDFSTLTLTRPKAEVAPETTEQRLADIATRNRDLLPIEDPARGDNPAAAPGEVLTVDFVGKVEGTEFPGGTATDIDVEVGGQGFIAGFAEQLEGMRVGEERTIEVTFPADYGMETLAGKPATFTVTAKQLRRPVPPAIDDELAKRIGFETLDEMRGFITERQQQEYDALSRLRLKRQLLDALSETASFPVPQGLVDQEFNQIWERLEADRKAGRLDEDDKDKDDETLRREYRAIAERRVRLGLLLAEIGRVNSLTVTADELTRAMRAEVARYPGHEAQMMELFRKYPQMTDGLRGPILEDKVVDFVLELANVTDQVVTPEELAKEPPTPSPAA